MSDDNDPQAFTDERAFTDDERALVDLLGAALGTEPLPERLVERAEGLVAWFDVDTEIVAMLEESLDEPIGARGGGSDTSLFVTSDRSTEIDVDVSDEGIVGHVISGEAVVAELLGTDGTATVTAAIDDLGRFELPSPGSGPHRLRLVDRAGRRVVTDWFVL